MDVVLYVIGALVIISFIAGFVGSSEMTIALEINTLNTLNTPFFKIGIFSQRYELEDGNSEDEIIIGLFLINIVVVFWKHYSEDEE